MFTKLTLPAAAIIYILQFFPKKILCYLYGLWIGCGDRDTRHYRSLLNQCQTFAFTSSDLLPAGSREIWLKTRGSIISFVLPADMEIFDDDDVIEPWDALSLSVASARHNNSATISFLCWNATMTHDPWRNIVKRYCHSNWTASSYIGEKGN